jgi:hypothetical protein
VLKKIVGASLDKQNEPMQDVIDIEVRPLSAACGAGKNLTMGGLVPTGKLPLVLLLRLERRLVADWSSRLNNGGTMVVQANWNGRALSCAAPQNINRHSRLQQDATTWPSLIPPH